MCLGVQFDMVQMTISVTPERLEEIKSLLGKEICNYYRTSIASQ